MAHGFIWDRILKLFLRWLVWTRIFIGGQAVFDAVAWVLALFLAAFLRYEFQIDGIRPKPLLLFGLLIALLSFVGGKTISLYRSRFRVGSLEEFFRLVTLVFVVSGVAFVSVISWGANWTIPRSVVLIAAPFFLMLSVGARVLRRISGGFGKSPATARRALVYGAGELAEMLIPQLIANPDAKLKPVGLVDDDPQKKNRWIAGIKMKGSGERLESILKSVDAEVVIIAISRAHADLFQRVEAVASRLGVEVLVLPSLNEMFKNPGRVLEFQNMGIEDLIGRKAVDINLSQIGSYLVGRKVLITGAGGSIGVELCRQVASFKPKQLIFLDRDETGLQMAQLATSDTGLLDGPDYVLADIRDVEVMRAIFLSRKPDVVLHAAALKHLPVLQRFPDEAWKTNVMGTLNVLRASKAAGVGTVINISTDKAADPSSLLGLSKNIAERLTSWFSEQNAGMYVSVRFGNVLGSRGSLVPTLAHKINSGGPITITHRDATRYFMTIPEACQLVLQAGALGNGGEVFVLDMGSPVKILDIARKMIDMAGTKVGIIFTGLRPGEKLHEELFSEAEVVEHTDHRLIFRVKSRPLNPRDLPKKRVMFEVEESST